MDSTIVDKTHCCVSVINSKLSVLWLPTKFYAWNTSETRTYINRQNLTWICSIHVPSTEKLTCSNRCLLWCLSCRWISCKRFFIVTVWLVIRTASWQIRRSLSFNNNCKSRMKLRPTKKQCNNATLFMAWISHMSSFAICRRPFVCLSSVVCNVRAPYSADWNFRQCFYAIWHLGHLWPFGKNFTEIVPGDLSVGGLNQREVEKCSDFGPFQGYISETVQNRR